jgi:hypothetical protein
MILIWDRWCACGSKKRGTAFGSSPPAARFQMAASRESAFPLRVEQRRMTVKTAEHEIGDRGLPRARYAAYMRRLARQFGSSIAGGA